MDGGHGTHGNLAEPYISSLSTVNPLNVKMGQPSGIQAHTTDQDMQRQEEEYKKSVTLIFWYKANTPPIRVQQMIPTFPWFQLSRFPSLVVDLGLSPTSYLDTYNPTTEQWDQHQISAVRMIETQQRMLYRIRKSLLDGLKDEECPGIYEEMELQRRVSKSFHACGTPTLPRRDSTPKGSNKHKRAATATPDDVDKRVSKLHVSSKYYMAQHIIQGDTEHHTSLSNDTGTTTTSLPLSPTQSIPTPPASSTSSIPHEEFVYPSPSVYDNTTSPSIPSTNPPITMTSSMTSLAYPPSTPTKRWPNDYTVAEIATGFNEIDSLIQPSANGTNMTHKSAFERVFGCRYVKSTVCRHKGVWKKAHPNLRSQYEAMGSDERAYWSEFVRHVEGRPPSIRVAGAGPGSGPHPNSSTPARARTSLTGVTSEEEDGNQRHIVDDPQILENLQNNSGQYGVTSPNGPMQNMNVFESTLAPMANTAHG